VVNDIVWTIFEKEEENFAISYFIVQFKLREIDSISLKGIEENLP
jgi:hypothetical protein